MLAEARAPFGHQSDDVSNDAQPNSDTGNRPALNQLPVSKGVISFGFVVGVLLAVACMALCAEYLFFFEQQTTSVVTSVLAEAPHAQTTTEITVIDRALQEHTFVARVMLLSCGVFVGMAFGFIGFCLFLLGIQGEVDASAQGPNNFTLRVARLSPGLFTILCAAILIGLCATHPIHFDTSLSVAPAANAVQQKHDGATDGVDTRMPGGQ